MKTEFLYCKSEVKASDAGHIEGYASVFSGIDSYGDTIEPTAFDKVLERGDMPRMFFNHDRWGLPIGAWDKMEKDEHGLFMRGRLNLSLKEGRDVYEAVRFGSVDGLSICFSIEQSSVDEDGIRHLRSVATLPEVSVVTYPADSAARIVGVKAALDGIDTITDFERLLRDAGGFSRGEAVALVAKARQILTAVPGDPGEAEGTNPALAAMRDLLNRIN